MTPAWHAPRTCKCGKVFTPKKNGAHMKYCSDLCAANIRQEQITEWRARQREARIKECGVEDKRRFREYGLRARDYVKAYPEGSVENLYILMKSYADLHGYTLNTDNHRVDMVLRGLLGRNVRFGLYYCPSRSLTGDFSFDAAIVCPCTFLEDDIQYRGHCFCKLFFEKVKEKSLFEEMLEELEKE